MRITIILVLAFSQIMVGQPNCELLKDSICVKACNLTIEAAKYQGSKHSQELFDQSISLCPTIAYAYYEKAVPYLKQGLFNEWKQLTDKAIELEPKYLLNRGISQIQFLRNYERGLDDLNKLFKLLNTFEIGYSTSGEYHGQKSEYNLDFLGLTSAVSERTLENQLVEHIRDLLMELGFGFCLFRSITYM